MVTKISAKIIAYFEEVSMNTQPPVSNAYADDEVLIRTLFQNLLNSWGSGDGYAYANQFTPDSDYVAFDGTHRKGREENAAAHQQLFDTWLKGTRLTGQVEGIRFLNSEIAIVHAVGGMLMTKHSTQPKRQSIQTLIAIKNDGSWRFTAFHNCRVQQRNWLQNMIFGISTRMFHR
jgi:uncharacterized protein (TIGR02246 family)